MANARKYRMKRKVKAALEAVDIRQKYRQGGASQAFFKDNLLSEKPFKELPNANDRTILC